MLDNAHQTDYCYNEFQQFRIFHFVWNQKASNELISYAIVTKFIHRLSTSTLRTPPPALTCDRRETV